MRSIVLLTSLAVLGMTASADAQYVYVGGPAVVPYTSYYAPVVVAPRRAAYYAPAVVPYAAPVAVTSYYAPTTSYYAPAPVSTYYAPTVATTSYYAPASPYPVVAGYAPAPVVAYRPAVVAQPAYVIGRGVVGQTKVYIPGQPVRNSVRFVTP